MAGDVILVLEVILLLNAWILIGFLALLLAVNRAAVERPMTILHSLTWMALWPLLLVRLAQRAVSGYIGRGKTPEQQPNEAGSVEPR